MRYRHQGLSSECRSTEDSTVEQQYRQLYHPDSTEIGQYGPHNHLKRISTDMNAASYQSAPNRHYINYLRRRQEQDRHHARIGSYDGCIRGSRYQIEHDIP